MSKRYGWQEPYQLELPFEPTVLHKFPKPPAKFDNPHAVHLLSGALARAMRGEVEWFALVASVSMPKNDVDETGILTTFTSTINEDIFRALGGLRSLEARLLKSVDL
jgi:hypothetical protein